MNEEMYNYIDDYYMGNLSEAEIAVFEDRLKSDMELKTAHEQYLLLKEVVDVEVEDDYRKMFTSIDSENENKSTDSSTTGGTYNKYWILATILSGIIILFFVIWKRANDINPVMVADNFSVQEGDLITRDVNQSEIDTELLNNYYTPLRKANEMIRAQQYEEAYQFIEQINVDSEIVQENKEWMKALISYLKNGRKDAFFQTTINKILDNPSHSCYQLAVNMDSKVNNFWGRLTE